MPSPTTPKTETLETPPSPHVSNLSLYPLDSTEQYLSVCLCLSCLGLSGSLQQLLWVCFLCLFFHRAAARMMLFPFKSFNYYFPPLGLFASVSLFAPIQSHLWSYPHLLSHTTLYLNWTFFQSCTIPRVPLAYLPGTLFSLILDPSAHFFLFFRSWLRKPSSFAPKALFPPPIMPCSNFI